MAIMYVMCGIAGSGKTTLAHKLKKSYDAIVHSYDDIPNSRRNPDKDGSLRKQYFSEIRKDLISGVNVFIDNINLTPESRIILIDKFSSVCDKKVAIFLKTPVEECLKRNAQRIGVARVPDMDIHIASMLIKPPTYSEGWDEIYFYQE